MKQDTFTALVSSACSRFADKTAIQFLRRGKVETRITYAQLDRDVTRMSDFFLNEGVKKGDRVILLLDKSVLFIIAHLALLKINAICVPLNPGFKRSEIDYFIKDAEPTMILAGRAQHGIIKKVHSIVKLICVDTQAPYEHSSFSQYSTAQIEIDKPNADDPGLIVYTSGTTGKPKGAVLTQGNLYQDAVNIVHTWAITAEDILLHSLPLFHIHGLCFALHTCLSAGGCVIMPDAFDARNVIGMLSGQSGKDACTVYMAVPAMYNALIDCIGEEQPDFSKLRLITSGSAPLLVKDFERIAKIWGREPVEREGMSETGMNFSNPLDGIKKPGSIGLPMPGLKARVVDPETMTDVQPGQVGEFWLKSPAITPGYWNKPGETQKTFQNGWFRTGDLGHVDEDGYYFLTDRIKNIIISGGENISPKEVESIINQLAAVAASCVVGIQDKKWGEKVVAAVTLKQGSVLTEKGVKEYCRKYLHPWKCPKQVAFVDVLPKNTMGKVLTDKVRELF